MFFNLVIVVPLVCIAFFVTPHPMVYLLIALCVNTFLSFGNGALGYGLEFKNPNNMTPLESKIWRGTATVIERGQNFIIAFVYGACTHIVHIIAFVIYLLLLGIIKLL